MISVLIVEDQYFARLALHTVIESQDEMRVVAETDKGTEALALYLRHTPAVTIMDLRLPGQSGFEAIRQIRAADPKARIVVLSNYDGVEDVHRALDAGASAYLTKDASAAELVKAILATHAGGRYLPAELSNLLRQRLESEELTPRELEVLQLLAQGLSNQSIADRLQIAEKTVRIHLTHVFGKLGVEDRMQAVLRANEMGLVHLD